jgi:hypothetical protein
MNTSFFNSANSITEAREGCFLSVWGLTLSYAFRDTSQPFIEDDYVQIEHGLLNTFKSPASSAQHKPLHLVHCADKLNSIKEYYHSHEFDVQEYHLGTFVPSHEY